MNSWHMLRINPRASTWLLTKYCKRRTECKLFFCPLNPHNLSGSSVQTSEKILGRTLRRGYFPWSFIHMTHISRRTMRSTASFSWELLTMTQAGTVTLHLQPRFMLNGCPITWRTEEFLSQELTLREDGVRLEFWSGSQVSGLKGAVIKTQMDCLWSEAITSLIWWCHIYILGKERSVNITLNG